MGEGHLQEGLGVGVGVGAAVGIEEQRETIGERGLLRDPRAELHFMSVAVGADALGQYWGVC